MLQEVTRQNLHVFFRLDSYRLTPVKRNISTGSLGRYVQPLDMHSAQTP